jgi:hypothetical protein
MPFTITWTGPSGSERIEVATAKEALDQYVALHGSAVKVVVKDNHGRQMKPEELAALDHISKAES